jgi:hypothetical protein
VTAWSWVGVIVLTLVDSVLSWKAETRFVESSWDDSVIPRIAVEAAMPMEPPRTRAWAMIPCATACRN